VCYILVVPCTGKAAATITAILMLFLAWLLFCACSWILATTPSSVRMVSCRYCCARPSVRACCLSHHHLQFQPDSYLCTTCHVAFQQHSTVSGWQHHWPCNSNPPTQMLVMCFRQTPLCCAICQCAAALQHPAPTSVCRSLQQLRARKGCADFVYNSTAWNRLHTYRAVTGL
jgi:hypothetical protein